MKVQSAERLIAGPMTLLKLRFASIQEKTAGGHFHPIGESLGAALEHLLGRGFLDFFFFRFGLCFGLLRLILGLGGLIGFLGLCGFSGIGCRESKQQDEYRQQAVREK
jgi:hypothetical protein